jgi:Icc protein
VWLDTMMISNSADFLAIIHRYPQAKTIIHGHIHQLLDKYSGDVRVLGVPSTCFQFKPLSVDFALDDTSPAYRHLQLYADGRVVSQISRITEALVNLQMKTKSY